MKKTSFTKTLLLLVVVAISTAGMAQTDSLANLFYQNVQTSNNVLRFEDNALASVRFDNGQISDDIQYYLKDESGATISSKQTNNSWNEVLFENLALDYTIHTNFQDQEYMVGSFNTRDNTLEPFEASSNLLQSLQVWYDIPQINRPEAMEYIFQQQDIPFFERIAYMQALFDMKHLPNTILYGESTRDIFEVWLDCGDSEDRLGGPPPPPDFDDIYEETLDFKPLDPNTLDKCICQYIMRTRPINSPLHPVTGNNYDYNRSTTKSHLGISSLNPVHHANSFKKVDVGTAGPMTSVDVFIRSEGRNSTRTVESGGLTSDPSTSANEHLAGFELYFFCEGLPQSIRSRLLLLQSANGETQDLSFLEPTPAEECLCEKEVQLCYRYDAEIQAKTEKTINCGVLIPVRERAVTVDNFVEVTLQQGSSAKETNTKSKI